MSQATFILGATAVLNIKKRGIQIEVPSLPAKSASQKCEIRFFDSGWSYIIERL
jgi:hypothetical protein